VRASVTVWRRPSGDKFCRGAPIGCAHDGRWDRSGEAVQRFDELTALRRDVER
jgi:hypothetical protein